MLVGTGMDFRNSPELDHVCGDGADAGVLPHMDDRVVRNIPANFSLVISRWAYAHG
jgi:hypothetical protein